MFGPSKKAYSLETLRIVYGVSYVNFKDLTIFPSSGKFVRQQYKFNNFWGHACVPDSK